MRKESGFLLLELLVVLALLALLAPPLTALLLAGREGLLLAGRRTVAATLAIEGLEMACCHFCEISSAGEAEVDGFAGYTRAVEVRDVAAAAGVLPLKEVNVTVSWQQGVRRQSVQLLTWRTWR